RLCVPSMVPPKKITPGPDEVLIVTLFVVSVAGEAVLIVNELAVILSAIFTALAVVLALVTVTAPRAVVAPKVPPKVTDPLVPANKVSAWALAAVPSMNEVEVGNKISLPPADPPPLVVSAMTGAAKI